METTPNLALPYLMPAQAQKHVTHNEALRALDALVQIGAKSRTLTEPPADPAAGDRYLVADGAAGAWAGRAHQLAAWQDGVWRFYAPQPGWLVHVADESLLLVWDGAAWTAAVGGLNPAPFVGVNAIADAANRFAVASPSSLFNHEGGGHQVKVNKAGSAETASVLFQTGWSGRAEFGLAGDDDWHVKVSPDGALWHEVLIAERATGRVSFPNTPMREVLSADRTYHVAASGGDNAASGLSASAPLATVAEALARCYRLDPNGHAVTIQLHDGTHGNFVVDRPLLGGGRLTIQGNAADASLVKITAGYNSIAVQGGAKVHIKDMELSNSDNWSCLSCREFADVYIGNLRFGAATGRNHIDALTGAIVTAIANYAIIGGAQTHLRFQDGAIFLSSGKTITISGTPNFSFAFAAFIRSSGYSQWSTVWSGAATGKRYRIETNATCNGGATAHFPGDVAGDTDDYGYYGWA